MANCWWPFAEQEFNGGSPRIVIVVGAAADCFETVGGCWGATSPFP
ncbi:MAG: hypothetical protein ACI8XD_000709, partial [Thermoproteota archaeon]